MARRNEVGNNTMTMDQTIVFGVLIVTLVLFITETWRYDVVAFMALMAVTLTGAPNEFIGVQTKPIHNNAAVKAISTNPSGTPSFAHSVLLICSVWAAMMLGMLPGISMPPAMSRP